MILAAASAYTCPFADAAGISDIGTYSGGGGMIQVNQQDWIQSTGNIHTLSQGQETLSGRHKTTVITVGKSAYGGGMTVDANDHQIVQTAGKYEFHGGGLVDAVSQIESTRREFPQGYQSNGNATVNVSANNTTANGTSPNQSVNITDSNESATSTLPRPYYETSTIDRGMMGNEGVFQNEMTTEQGADNAADYMVVNTKAMGSGGFWSTATSHAAVGFDPTDPGVNYEMNSKQHEAVFGSEELGYNVTKQTAYESFNDAFMHPVANNTSAGQS